MLVHKDGLKNMARITFYDETCLQSLSSRLPMLRERFCQTKARYGRIVQDPVFRTIPTWQHMVNITSTENEKVRRMALNAGYVYAC